MYFVQPKITSLEKENAQAKSLLVISFFTVDCLLMMQQALEGTAKSLPQCYIDVNFNL